MPPQPLGHGRRELATPFAVIDQEVQMVDPLAQCKAVELLLQGVRPLVGGEGPIMKLPG